MTDQIHFPSKASRAALIPGADGATTTISKILWLSMGRGEFRLR